ncbi:uncharacterized protein LOC110265765 [Arachis ipaensis]|uniref:uncharacterized protein LOC110265765 n=1 Tax=Arachis ipaensis TaxID=130454 RepID=UPI000A2B3A85|nr:uncharacterized protein LOC110265765 [Arachis ipaensis]
MRFGTLRHIPELNVSHKLSRELILCFDLYHAFLDTHYGKIYITPTKIGHALGLNSGEKKKKWRRHYQRKENNHKEWRKNKAKKGRLFRWIRKLKLNPKMSKIQK